jgi:hypothetical protein
MEQGDTVLHDMHQQAPDAVARKQAVPAGLLRMMRQAYAFVWCSEGSNKCQNDCEKDKRILF